MRDRIRNVEFLKKVGVADIEDKIRGDRLNWLGHVKQSSEDAPVREINGSYEENFLRSLGRPKMTWIEWLQMT